MTKILKSCIKSLEIINSDEESINREIQSAIQFSVKLGEDPLNEFAIHHRRRLAPKKLDNNRDNLFTPELLTFYRMEFKKVLDTLTVMMADNLNSCIDIITPVYEIINPPLTRQKLTLDLIKKVVDFFPKTQAIADIEALQAELEVLSDFCSETETMDEISKKSESLKNILPLANRICRLALTSPVTVASNERTFSKLKIVKNYLRTTMTDPRLNALVLLTCEKDILDCLDLSTVVSRWARLKKRRVKIHTVP